MKTFACIRSVLVSSLFLGLLSTSALAATQELVCTTGQPYETFRVTLDRSGWDPGSGFFNITRASIIDNYAMANSLECIGNRLEDIVCIGFWFNSPDEIVQVNVQHRAGKTTSTYRPLVGKYAHHVDPWNCTL